MLPTIGTFILILVGSEAFINRLFLSNEIIVRFGLISFPLYLWHWSLLSFAEIIAVTTPSGEVKIAVVIISIVLAWMTYIFIERPIRFGKRGGRKAIFLCVFMSFIGFAGYSVYDRNGFSFRFPKILQEFSSLTYDYRIGYGHGTCFLDPKQDEHSLSDCTEAASISPSTSVLLWGDSHALHLYPAIRKKLSNEITLTHLTAAGCAPILEMNFLHCLTAKALTRMLLT